MKKIIILSLMCFNVYSLKAKTVHDETNTIHTFFLANYHQSKGELEKAKKGYQQLLLAPDTPISVYKGYLPLLAATKNYAQIVALMPRLNAHFEKDPDIQLIFAQALEAVGRQKEADELYIKLSRSFPTHQEIVYQAVNSYRRNQERNNAIQIIDDLLNRSPRKPNNFIFHFMKAQLFAELSDPTNARVSVSKSLELYPQFDKGWLLFGMLEENAGKLDDAIKGYTNYLELSGTPNQQLEKHLLELLIKRRMQDTKKKAMAVDNQCLLEGLSLFQQKQYHKGMESINKCLDKEPKSKDATIIKINLLGEMRKRRQAARLLNACLHEEPHNEFLYTQLHTLCAQGLSERRAIKMLRDVIHEHPHAPLAHIHLAELYTQKGRIVESIFHYQQALAYVTNSDVETRIMYNLACLHSQAHHFERMKSLLSSILKKNSNFTPAYHLLAYHYLEYEYDIPQAESLLAQAIKQDPMNPYYRLTHARLLHAQGNYDDALNTLNHIHMNTMHHALIDEERAAIAYDYIQGTTY